MRYPNRDEYDLALQSPNVAFDLTGEPGLIGGRVCSDPRLTRIAQDPRRLCAVYKFLSADDPPRMYALRCFTNRSRGAVRHNSNGHAAIDIPERYRRLRDSMTDELSHALVPTRFFDIDEGLQVTGFDGETGVYPFVLMDWIDGWPLIEYLDHVYRGMWRARPQLRTEYRSALQGLIDQLRDLMILFHHQMAHSDLAASNMIVRRSDQKLVPIDYDLVYLPGMTEHDQVVGIQHGFAHPELPELYGFTHPVLAPIQPERRTVSHTDYFSTLVLYTALLALRVNPNLWQQFMVRNPYTEQLSERLLFTQQDFKVPEESELFREIERSATEANSDDLRRAIAELREACFISFAHLESPTRLFAPNVVDPIEFQAHIQGANLHVSWRWPAQAIDGVAVAWSHGGAPALLPGDSLAHGRRAHRVYYWHAKGQYSETKSLHIRSLRAGDRLHVALIPVRYAGEADSGDYSETADFLASTIALSKRRIKCCMTTEIRSNSAQLHIQAEDRQPLPDLVVVQRQDSPPHSAYGCRRMHWISDAGTSSLRIKFEHVSNNFLPRTFLGVFAMHEEERPFIKAVGTLQITP